MQQESPFRGKVVLITGGTGSFGKAFCRYLLSNHQPKAVRIYSRDELKQYEMAQQINDPRLRFFLGDVRDGQRLKRAAAQVDIIVHAAALKQVPACEYNPFEAIKTNIMGSVAVVDAAIDCGVKKTIALSTDKAVSPVNLYGATKLCSEKVFIHGNSYSGSGHTTFACVRYGNVLGSRGSVLPAFLRQKSRGLFTITDMRMTRFWITLAQAVQFVALSVRDMVGGEIFVPKLPSLLIADMAKAIDPQATLKEIGIRPGEKIHETLIMKEEASHTLARDQDFIVLPEWFHTETKRPYSGGRLPAEFQYTSDRNDQWLSVEEMRHWIEAYEHQEGLN